MILLRVLGLWFLIAAVIALVYDATLTLGSGAGLATTSLAEFWQWLNVASFRSAASAVRDSVSPVLWDVVILTVLNWPIWVTCSLLGLLFFVGGRKRRGIDIFVN